MPPGSENDSLAALAVVSQEVVHLVRTEEAEVATLQGELFGTTQISRPRMHPRVHQDPGDGIAQAVAIQDADQPVDRGAASRRAPASPPAHHGEVVSSARSARRVGGELAGGFSLNCEPAISARPPARSRSTTAVADYLDAEAPASARPPLKRAMLEQAQEVALVVVLLMVHHLAPASCRRARP